jgi:hypothetical protein
LVFDFTVACVILGLMECVKEGSIESLGLDGRIDWSVDRGTEDVQADELMVDPLRKDSMTESDRLIN